MWESDGDEEEPDSGTVCGVSLAAAAPQLHLLQLSVYTRSTEEELQSVARGETSLSFVSE